MLVKETLLKFLALHLISADEWLPSGFRWIKLRTSLIPVTAILEPASECLLMGVGGSWAVSSLFDWSGLAFFFVHALLWFLLDYILLLVLQVSVFGKSYVFQNVYV